MFNTQGSKPRSDLEERTFKFAQEVRQFVRKLPRGVINTVDGTQLVRSLGSVGANYIEAQEAMSKKDFGMRVKICRKEAKESSYWLSLLSEVPSVVKTEQTRLVQEARELVRIFSSMVQKTRTDT